MGIELVVSYFYILAATQCLGHLPPQEGTLPPIPQRGTIDELYHPEVHLMVLQSHQRVSRVTVGPVMRPKYCSIIRVLSELMQVFVNETLYSRGRPKS